MSNSFQPPLLFLPSSPCPQPITPPISDDHPPITSSSRASSTEGIAGNLPYPPRWLPADISELLNPSKASRDNIQVLGDLVNHDWEAVRYFLLCQVRPGGDVCRVFRCDFCGHEFPNAQAFGGHMSSHSKTKKMKRARRGQNMSGFGEAAGGRKRMKMATAVAEKEEEGGGSEGDEWFKYLNSEFAGM